MRKLLVVAAALLVGLMVVAAIAPTSSDAQAAKSFKVSSRIGWQQTPLNVTKGSEYSVAYKIGDWTVDYRNFDYVGPQGYPPSIDSQIYQGCKLNSNWPYARLLAKVGTNGSLFSVGGNSFSNVGDVRTFTASANGSLYLRIHDDDRCLGDNGGSITVNLSTGKEPGTGGAPPAAPSKLSVAAVDSSTIQVKWVDNSDNEGGFQIHNGETTRTVGANKTTYAWGGLEPGTYMCFRVRSYNKAGSSAWEPNKSPWYKCTTTPSTPSPTKQPSLSLPWSPTDGATTWYYSGGPHCDLQVDPGKKCPSNAVRYAVDFMPPGQPGCSVKREESGWVTAAGSGIVRASSKSLVEIDHGNGFRTGYYHLRSDTIQVQIDQKVGVTDKLGRPSCEAKRGGTAGGTHVHFYICEQTDPNQACGPYATSSAVRPIDGLVIGGWTIHAAVGQNYDGTMTKGKELRTAIAVQCGPGNANANCGNDLNHLKR